MNHLRRFWQRASSEKGRSVGIWLIVLVLAALLVDEVINHGWGF